MARYAHSEPAPENAEIYGAIKIHRWQENRKYYAKVWRGRAQKPYAYYVWPKAETREAWIEQQKQDADDRAQFKRELKEDRARRKAEMVAAIGVGTVLHCSWGYDQTNCDFYEVIDKKGQTVTLRPIAGKDVGPSSGMATRLQPQPGQFTGEAFKKRITEYGVSFKHGSARPVDPERSFYSSWYA